MNKVMLIGRLEEIEEKDEYFVISLKIRTQDYKDNIIIDVIIKSYDFIENVKTKISKQSLIGIQGYLEHLNSSLVVIANKITFLTNNNESNDNQ